MNVAAPDPIPAILSFLHAHPNVDGVAYGGSLPASEVQAADPNRTIVVRFGGEPGVFGRGQRYGDIRIDVFCTAATDIDATSLHRQVYGALKHLSRETHEGVLLHWAHPSGGSGETEDADTGWPQVISTWQVLVSEMEVVA